MPFLCFLLFSACVHIPPQGNDIAALTAPTIDTRLPYPLARTLAHEIDSRSKIERVEIDKPGIFRVWIPEYNYRPNEFIRQFDENLFLEVFTAPFLYVPLALIEPPFFSYAWDEVPNSYDPEGSRNLEKKLREKSRDLYSYLDSPPTKRYDIYSNEYVWSSNDRRAYRRWSHIWSQVVDVQTGYFAPVTEKIVSFDYKLSLSMKLLKHPAPPQVLKQGRFESSRHYKTRVIQASLKAKKYEAYLRKINKDAIKEISEKEDLIIYRTFSLYFGSPKILRTSYDPDGRLFGVMIGGKNGGAFAFMLADRVMNDQAPAYEKRLKESSPLIYLRLSKGILYLDGGYVMLKDGTSERILPYRKKDYQLKENAVGSFPLLIVPSFDTPEVRDNTRMQNEGADIEKDTGYFRGQK